MMILHGRSPTIKAIILSGALLLAACQTPAANVCDGWERMTPSAATRGFIVAQDRPFAEQVAAHNQFGATRKCWRQP